MSTRSGADWRGRSLAARRFVKKFIGQTSVKYFKFWRARALERVGSRAFSFPALYGMDKALIGIIGTRHGFFIEVGANDGFAQSNTYALERLHGWRGILIEPVPRLHRMCVRFRPDATVFNCALGPAQAGDYAVLAEALMLEDDLDSKLLARAGEGGDGKAHVAVPVRTLSSIIDECGSPDIDLFSLDVEGREIDVLRGLDLSRHRPTYILVETDRIDAVSAELGEHYRIVGKLSHHDFLFKRDGSLPPAEGRAATG